MGSDIELQAKRQTSAGVRCAGVRFGLFYEHQLPRPHPEGAEEKLLRDALEQVELADRLGLHSVWEVEHHFLGVLAQLGARVRLGSGPRADFSRHGARI